MTKPRLYEYLYRLDWPSNIEGYRPYQIRLQRHLQTNEFLVSLSTGSRFMVFPYQDLDNFIMELITLRTKLNELIKKLLE